MDVMTVEQLLTRAQAIMTDKEHKELVAMFAQQMHTDKEVLSTNSCRGVVICYRCSGPKHMAKDCMQGMDN